ncbi:hypothetical protein SLEP1_g34087 [Rubroshorea leprosula]|uniref:Disease resistance R13L4/SHOC-2-like LRR domain-containing protein n=1 Tax=Rubroshorea leprosula TaxID=152421 RepID=A0AAV5KIQ1_9ROSI|nr:hypothetical protein SLEP1_g34087 [Rubroshorea leprosula]
MQGSFRHKKEKIAAEDEGDQEPEDKMPFRVERDTNARSPNCPFLVALSLEGCKALSTIPSSFFEHMPVLKYLNLSHTSIRSLPVSLFKLDSLEHLIQRCCKLVTELSPQIRQLHNLLELDLDATQIVGLPKEIGMLSKLKILNVSLDGYMNCGKQLQQNVLIHPGTIRKCDEIQTYEEEQTDVVEGEATNCESYYDQEHALFNLQFLHIYYLENFESIWSTPNYDKLSPSPLKVLELHTCPRLEVILSPALLINPGKLEVLTSKTALN